jgi:hypothetical protein
MEGIVLDDAANSEACRRRDGGVGSAARVLLAGEIEVREEYMAGIPTRGLKRLSRFESTKSSDLRFRALLADGTSEVELALD